MKLSKSLNLLLGATAMVSMYGCGSDNRESNVDQQSATFQASAACISCHATNKTSPVTGALIVEEWKLSAHNLNSGAACTDCHTNNGHPNGGSIVAAVQDTQCGTCHTVAGLGAPHYALFANTTTARYVGLTNAQDVQKCRTCHNPHDTTSVMQINRDWADSGHGDVAGPAFSGRTWYSNSSCNRCHTSTGYVNYVNSGGTTLATFSGTNEVIGCKACHSDYSWARRTVGAVVEPRFSNLSGSIEITFPNSGESNICLTCHIGREAGASIQYSTSNFTNRSFINSHYLTAGGIVFGKIGYEYAGRSYVKPAFYQHDLVGAASGAGTADGPCVGCHMKTTTSHKFQPVAKDGNGVITAITSTACATCHTGGFALTAADLEAEKAGLKAATEALEAVLRVINVHFYEAHPYFYNAQYVVGGVNTGVTNWVKFDPVALGLTANEVGKRTMGAAFNLNTIKHDPGAYAHNRFYTKRLIYDSIDWANDGLLDNDVEASINATSLTAGEKAEAIDYLLGGPGGARP